MVADLKAEKALHASLNSKHQLCVESRGRADACSDNAWHLQRVPQPARVALIGMPARHSTCTMYR